MVNDAVFLYGTNGSDPLTSALLYFVPACYNLKYFSD